MARPYSVMRLEKAGISLNVDGAVPVDNHGQTKIDSIYAVGDVTNHTHLTPVAIREGHAVADTLFGGKPTPILHELIPTAVFSTPEIGTVGLTEAAARAKYGKVTIFKTSFRNMKATLSGSDERTFMKVVVHPTSDKILGVHIAGDDAAELIQIVGVAVMMGATKADFDRTIAVHPTAAEELVTMRMASSWTKEGLGTKQVSNRSIAKATRIDAKLAIMSVAARLFAEIEIFRAEHLTTIARRLLVDRQDQILSGTL